MSYLALIGGSGCYSLAQCPHPSANITTPYGAVAGIMQGNWQDVPMYFLPRHGNSHGIAPHNINYRANIWALKSLGVSKILAFNAVGSFFNPPGTWFLPRQIIDYTYGREHTFFDDFSQGITHIDFTEPLNLNLINAISQVLYQTDLLFSDTGVYGCTQGPRLETAAEIKRLEHDGCTLVGMTLMPEAALAAEVGIAYASLCLSVNWAAGKNTAPISLDMIQTCLQEGQENIARYLPQIIDAVQQVTV